MIHSLYCSFLIMLLYFILWRMSREVNDIKYGNTGIKRSISISKIELRIYTPFLYWLLIKKSRKYPNVDFLCILSISPCKIETLCGRSKWQRNKVKICIRPYNGMHKDIPNEHYHLTTFAKMRHPNAYVQYCSTHLHWLICHIRF